MNFVPTLKCLVCLRLCLSFPASHSLLKSSIILKEKSILCCSLLDAKSSNVFSSRFSTLMSVFLTSCGTEANDWVILRIFIASTACQDNKKVICTFLKFFWHACTIWQKTETHLCLLWARLTVPVTHIHFFPLWGIRDLKYFRTSCYWKNNPLTCCNIDSTLLRAAKTFIRCDLTLE